MSKPSKARASHCSNFSTEGESSPNDYWMGYASISSQPAKSINQRRLMAIRAARLEAMRNLTEQVHGIKVNSRTTIIDAIVQNDSYGPQSTA